MKSKLLIKRGRVLSENRRIRLCFHHRNFLASKLTVFAFLVVCLQVNANAVSTRVIRSGANSSFEENVVGTEEATVVRQDRTQAQLKGKVFDPAGLTLPGVSISLKGTNQGTVTDANGTYTLIVPDESGVLIFSYIGFETQEISFSGSGTYNVTMAESMEALDEIVVIGYGTTNKKDLTGAVEVVQMQDLNQAPVASFSEALAGRVAGVQVSSNDAQPGETPNIIIRGAGSLTQSSAPLYVVDGFPIEDFIPATLSNSDIASISILKDASATAIYGARAANGVVVIETKKGKVGKPVIDINASYGFQDVTNFMEMMSPYEFIKYNYEFNPTLTTERYFYDGRTLETYRDKEGINWQEEVFRTSPMQNHNISMRGGTENTRYSISGSVFDQEGVLLNTAAKRYQGRISLDQKVSDKVSVGINANYSNVQSSGVKAGTSIGEGQESGYLFYNVWGYRPISGNENIDLLVEDVDPDVIGLGSIVVNPVKTLENTYREQTTKSLLSNLYLSYDITKDLSLKVTGGIDSRIGRVDQFYNSLTPQGSPESPNNTRGINAEVRSVERNTWSNENLLRYKKKINADHALDVLGGFSIQKTVDNVYGVAVGFIPNEGLGMSGLDEGIPYANDAAISQNTLASFFGRVNYNFKSKYLFTATFRGDGTSKFAPGKKWGYFPSGAFAWNMAEEAFLKRVAFLSTAKLRTSYGVTGNNRVSDFAYLPSLSLPQNEGYSFGNSTPTQGVIPSDLGNADLRWETTHQLDIGYDLGFFNNRIELTADVYRKTTTDLLLNADLPPSTGFPNVYNNIGKLRNEGLELSLNTVNIETPSFFWQTSFNISFNRNEVLALTRGQQDLYSSINIRLYNRNPLYVARVGGPAASFYGFVFDGVYQFEDFDQTGTDTYVLKEGVPNNGGPRESIQPGDIKYRDVTGDGQVNDDDRTIIGRGMPLHIGGFTNNFRYKGFDLGVFFQWSYGSNIFNGNRLIFEGNGLSSNDKNQFASYIDRWTPENPTNKNYRAGGAGPQGWLSSRTLEDGSYLRLKTLSFGYSLPAELIGRANISRLRIGVAAQNLLTWTNYSGMDPEVSVRNTILTPGFDYSAYPNYRTLVFTLNASF